MMKKHSIGNRVMYATKWASIAEFSATLVVPITSMVLARLLTPEAFGVVATINIIVTFADVFTDAGFQKYLIQHEFESKEHQNQCTTVAFWTNFGISILIWLVIAIFRDGIAVAVGSPGLGFVLMIAALSLPMTSFSSIQMALYRRDFEYKTLFYRRIIGALLPFLITIPIAYFTGSYWALVIGTLSQQLFYATILTVRSTWKPTLFFDVKLLKEMLSFSLWTLLESIVIWLGNNVDVFMIGALLSTYHLGVYKTSSTIVSQIFTIATNITTPILFASLCRKQNSEKEFFHTFLSYQKNVALLLFPLGAGVYLYRELATTILLGNQWSDAYELIGLLCITKGISIVMSHYCSEVYRAKGLPKISTLSQVLFLCMLIPTIYITAQMDFRIFYISRCVVTLCFMLIHFVMMTIYIKIYPWQMIWNVVPAMVGTVIMMMGNIVFQELGTGLLWDIISIMLCIVIYFLSVLMFPSVRKEGAKLISYIKDRKRDKP